MSGWTGPIQSTILKGPTGYTGYTGYTGMQGQFFTTLSVLSAGGQTRILSPTSFVIDDQGGVISSTEPLALTTNGIYLELQNMPIVATTDVLEYGVRILNVSKDVYAHITYLNATTSTVEIYQDNVTTCLVTFTYTAGQIITFYLDGLRAYFLKNGVSQGSIPYTSASINNEGLLFFMNAPSLAAPLTLTSVRYYPTGRAGPTGPTLPVVGTGTGSVLLQNPDDSNVYVNSSLQLLVSSTTNILQVDGHLIPSLDNTYTLGAPDRIWKDLYVGTGTVHIGDATIGATGTTLVINGSLRPAVNNTMSLGGIGSEWKEIYMGPGSLNIAGPTGATNPATIGSDIAGVAYSQFGFATPFLNVGPAISTFQAVGGWNIGATGPVGGPGFDLVARQIVPAGLTGTLQGPGYSMVLHPTPSTLTTDNLSTLFAQAGTATVTNLTVSTATCANAPIQSNQLVNKAYVDLVKTYMRFGNVYVVDLVNGNDSTGAMNGPSYATVAAAIEDASGASVPSTVWILPGTHELSSNLTIPANTSLRGMSVQTTILQRTISGDATMITMSAGVRIEDLTLTLTSSSGAANLKGIYFPSATCLTAKVRTCVINVDSGATAGAGNVYAIYSDGANTSGPPTFSYNALKGITINVYSRNSGVVRGVLLEGSAILSTRDTNIFVSSIGTGIETQGTAIAQLRTTAISGGTNDITQTGGSIQLGSGVDLMNHTTGSKPFTTFQYPQTVFYGVKGDVFSNAVIDKGYLWPGSVNAQKGTGTNPDYPDQSTANYYFAQSSICFGLQASLTTAPTTNGSGVSTLIYLLRNSNATPFVLGYGSSETGVKTYYASTFTFAPQESLSIYISSTVSGGVTNRTHDLTLQVELY